MRLFGLFIKVVVKRVTQAMLSNKDMLAVSMLTYVDVPALPLLPDPNINTADVTAH